MLSISEMKQLVKLVDESSLTEFEYETEKGKIKMKKGGEHVTSPVVSAPTVQAVLPAPQLETTEVTATPTTSTEDLHVITSPMVGTFYSSPNPESPAFVEVGAMVHEKTVVAIIEAMKLLNDVDADVTGEIVEILASNGELVEFGQPLFKVRKK
ncbi:acetyl-CoA carboxylase biotin carboxyl carrier protein [Paenilisteria rocourtiae]|uniref:Biotin carboxyl carrier protein of acetyl-CoA carboxylase n=1 Tax=Listeria rocourtiae TaxID=647910 RepID=A0A4R6ZNS7_9LIST|nr:acetyl-CoA carboxylase biotin carboxyl carrier protein [Listeria rocourtiae]EUJ51194.1 acetyl-CoA carboxylase biotin carboxyl carrier family protein [Listeria rocourtiae FSL F6-920]MBC1434193.1 acetyl-CoA carboxylase biotin carboxyl carrier protein [Listeria rocourtiae]MBC1603718.1 acetyl-CoA carboxylase biotin carboxyl carrier protein [Listeria rocourtiae]TDR54078.1 biotin carboxyl carrier protein [Listeria rocourtiae]